MKVIIFIVSGIVISVLFLSFFMSYRVKSEMKLNIESVQDVINLFPKTVKEITERVKKIKEVSTKEIQNILDIPDQERSFENTARAFDRAASFNFSVPASTISVLSYVSTEDSMRNAAKQAEIELSEFAVDMFGQHVELYRAFKAYVEENANHEALTDEQLYFLKETMDDFKRKGLHLDQEQRETIKKLKKRLVALSVEFQDAINTDSSSIMVTRDELSGMDDDFIKGLNQTSDGNYILKTDYPTVYPILEYCHAPTTRKNLYHIFVNRAYPKNVATLNEIIALRDQLARVLGFESYAALNIDNEMAKNPARVREFLDSIVEKATIKEQREYEQLMNDLPLSVIVVDGKIQPWDVAYIEAQYKKKHFNSDEREIATYFPMEKTVQGLLGIYKKFFNVLFTEIPVSGLWHDEVTMIQVQKKENDAILGYLLLDLYPRQNKYTHACQITIMPPLKKKDGSTPAVSVVIANFPKSTPDKPSLLNLSDVRTFFHEFGHAMHEILGATDSASFAGTRVKTDFVELPSQMLEEWLWDAEILKMMGSHFKTGLPMSDDLIATIIGLKNFSSGGWVLRQSLYSFMSLDCFSAGSTKNVIHIMNDLREKLLPHVMEYSENHSPFSFGHLTDYGARYYSYLWSKIFALDLFSYIKQFGLLNPEIGQRYVETILAKGGSKDPGQLLKDFLGREPNEEAFFEDLGLSVKNKKRRVSERRPLEGVTP